MRVILNEENFFIRDAEDGEAGAIEAPYLYGVASQHQLVDGQWHFDPNVLTTSEILAAEQRDLEGQWRPVRAYRDRLLQRSDWTQLPDVPLTTKEAWAAYRQALRDVTLQPDPFNIVWPTPPA